MRDAEPQHFTVLSFFPMAPRLRTFSMYSGAEGTTHEVPTQGLSLRDHPELLKLGRPFRWHWYQPARLDWLKKVKP